MSPDSASAARYFSTSNNNSLVDFGNPIALGMSQDVASVGMALSGGGGVMIDDAGFYVFSYSISFGSRLNPGSSNILAQLFEFPATVIPGSEARGGSFQADGDREFGTVAASCIYRLVGAGQFLVTLVATSDAASTVSHSTLTAHRIAT